MTWVCDKHIVKNGDKKEKKTINTRSMIKKRIKDSKNEFKNRVIDLTYSTMFGFNP